MRRNPEASAKERIRLTCCPGVKPNTYTPSPATERSFEKPIIGTPLARATGAAALTDSLNKGPTNSWAPSSSALLAASVAPCGVPPVSLMIKVVSESKFSNKDICAAFNIAWPSCAPRPLRGTSSATISRGPPTLSNSGASSDRRPSRIKGIPWSTGCVSRPLGTVAARSDSAINLSMSSADNDSSLSVASVGA